MFLIVDGHIYAEGSNVFPPDEDDIATIFTPLREMCNEKVVCN